MSMDRRAFTGLVLKAIGAAAAGPKDLIPAVEALAQAAPMVAAKPASLVFKLAGSMQMSLDVSSIRSLYDINKPVDFGASRLGKERFAKIHAITDSQERAAAVGKETVVILRSMVNAIGETSNAFDADTVAAILNDGALSPAAAAIKASIEKDLATLPVKGAISRRSVGELLKDMARRRLQNGPASTISPGELDMLIEHISPPEGFCVDDLCAKIKSELETVAKEGLQKHGVVVQEHAEQTGAKEKTHPQQTAQNIELQKIHDEMMADHEMLPWIIRAGVAREQKALRKQINTDSAPDKEKNKGRS